MVRYPIYHADGSISFWKGTAVGLSVYREELALLWLLGQVALWLDACRSVHWYPLGGVVTTACGLKAGYGGTTASVYSVTCAGCKRAVEDSFRGPKRPTDAPTEGQS